MLVLLPAATGATRLARVTTLANFSALQRQLGPAIQVLQIDEATHSAVVRSFDGPALPAFVLLRHGVELWRQVGLPNNQGIFALLISKLAPILE